MSDKIGLLKLLMSDLVDAKKQTQAGNLRRGEMFLAMAHETAFALLEKSDPIWKHVSEAWTEFNASRVKSSAAVDVAIKLLRDKILQTA